MSPRYELRRLRRTTDGVEVELLGALSDEVTATEWTAAVIVRALNVSEGTARAMMRTWSQMWKLYDSTVARGGAANPPPVPRTAPLRIPGAAGRPPHACTREDLAAWLGGVPAPRWAT